MSRRTTKQRRAARRRRCWSFRTFRMEGSDPSTAKIVREYRRVWLAAATRTVAVVVGQPSTESAGFVQG